MVRVELKNDVIFSTYMNFNIYNSRCHLFTSLYSISSSKFFHAKFVITLVAFELLSTRVTGYYFKLTFCSTFWTFTIYSFLRQTRDIQQTVY